VLGAACTAVRMPVAFLNTELSVFYSANYNTFMEVSMKILVADDDFVNRRFLEKIFGEYGEVVAVDNGMSAVDEAVRAMESASFFDLICLDIMMTRLDGYKTLEAIREAENKYKAVTRARVIMISALDEVALDSIQVCSDYDAYVCKPIAVDKFSKLMDKFGFSKK
jgi:two-component system chemotaxis response regulator CheY